MHSSLARFPNDENGAVLQRMLNDGDDLTRPRNVDFNFIFPDRQLALAFAETVDEQDLQVCISYYEERPPYWDVTVTRYMVPTHQSITALEADLLNRAESFGGLADGWGCMMVRKKS